MVVATIRFLRSTALAALALFVALGGTSYTLTANPDAIPAFADCFTRDSITPTDAQ